MVIQIHLSEKCNLKCKHCYQGERNNDIMPLGEYEKILDSFDSFSINLTGGEPLLIPDIEQYIKLGLLKAEKVVLMTNGTLITEKNVDYLVGTTVQISIDGTRSTHDAIRGIGSYDKAMRGIEILKNRGIRVSVACTLHQDNYKEVMQIVESMQHVDYIWFDRYVPCADAKQLTTEQFIEAMSAVAGAAERYKNVGTKRAMQFLFSFGGVYRCSALLNSLTVMPDGTVYPCRRMPIEIGNCFTEPLKSIYDRNESLRQKIQSIPAECSSCGYKERCRGGSKCLSHACGGFGKDINCFI